MNALGRFDLAIEEEAGLASESTISSRSGAPGETDAGAEGRANRPLSDAAKRALAEAQARRLTANAPLPPEVDGRGGLEPVRYGDWEIKGLASDF
jgi:hypothetical protein